MGPVTRRSRLFDVAITMVILAVLYGTLSHYLSQMSESAERAAMQTTLMQIQRHVTLNMAQRSVKGEGGAANAAASSNPCEWFDTPPNGYQGEIARLADLPQTDKRAVWYFDASTRHLVYLVNRGDHLIYQDQGSEAKRLQILRFVLNLSSNTADNRGIQTGFNATLSAVDQYRWDMDTSD